jgi:hypothetical protein
MTSFNEVGRDSETKEPKKLPCKRGKFVAIILTILIVGAICCHIHHSRPIGPKPGTHCTVQFRRDVLGETTNLVSPQANIFNGSVAYVEGELITVNREAILLRIRVNNQTKRVWIPKKWVLLIEYNE